MPLPARGPTEVGVVLLPPPSVWGWCLEKQASPGFHGASREGGDSSAAHN